MIDLTSTFNQIVQSYYAAFNRQDWPGMLRLLDEDVVHDINQGGKEIGTVAFKKFLDHMESCYEEKIENLVVMANGSGRVAAEFDVVGKYLKADQGLPPARGQTYKLRAGAFLEVVPKSLKIKRVTTYYNLKEWLDLVR